MTWSVWLIPTLAALARLLLFASGDKELSGESLIRELFIASFKYGATLVVSRLSQALYCLFLEFTAY